jgi:hypothetical protein
VSVQRGAQTLGMPFVRAGRRADHSVHRANIST